MNNMHSDYQAPVRNGTAAKAGLAALIAAAAMTVTSSQVMAAPSCFTTPIPVPVTTSGIYVNLATGAAGPSSTTGWDFNPWGMGSAFFYVPTTTPTTGFAGAGGVVSNLANGTMVDGSSTFQGNAGDATSMGTYRAGVTNGNLGMRFVEGGNTYYAWVNVSTTAPTGLPVTINRWCYENTPGTGILVGTMPVSLQTFSVE